MTNDQPAFDPMHEAARASEFVPEFPDAADVFQMPVSHYPINLKLEFDPPELRDAQDFSENDVRVECLLEMNDTPDPVVDSVGTLDTPEGYTAPEFESTTSVNDQDLDALFSELAETSSGQSADVAVWCPWLADALQG